MMLRYQTKQTVNQICIFSNICQYLVELCVWHLLVYWFSSVVACSACVTWTPGWNHNHCMFVVDNLYRKNILILEVYYDKLACVCCSMAQGSTGTVSGRIRSASLHAAHRMRSYLLRMLHQFHCNPVILWIPHLIWMSVWRHSFASVT